MKNLPMNSNSKFKQTVINITEDMKYSGNKTQIRCMSSYEYKAFKLIQQLVKINKIINWNSEEVIIKYFSSQDNKQRNYYLDFMIETKDKIYLVEVKPYKQTQKPKLRKNSTQKQINRYHKEMQDYILNHDKWAATKEYVNNYNSNNPYKEMSFVIWTETTLRI